jgi:hypothetical protein
MMNFVLKLLLILNTLLLIENYLFFSVFLNLNFVECKQQQRINLNHTTATLSEARCCLAATSLGELVFFAGGENTTGPSARVDMLNVSSGSWTTTTLSQPRSELAATSSSRNLVFFGGGLWNVTTFSVSDLVDMFDFKKVLYLDPRRMGRLIRNKDTCKLLLYS